MSSRRSSFRRKEKPPFERFKDHFRRFMAFLFSNVGIILLVIFYTIGGAIVFRAIETSEYRRLKVEQPHRFNRSDHIKDCYNRIWEMTAENISFYNQSSYTERVDHILLEFQRLVVHKQFKEQDVEKQWSMAGAVLYALTVITTIGYGNISPKSDWGKLATIVYAIIGMPLFLLYLSNIGDVLAKSFKWIYSKICLCRMCPGVARRRKIRERRKLRRIQKAMDRALRDMENGSSSNSNSNSSSNSYSSSEYSEETESSSKTTSSMGENVAADEDDESDSDDEIEESTDEITVPLTVCIMIMIAYILSGAFLFKKWEGWRILDGSYFCLISLSSIGFGDLVPGKRLITSPENVEGNFILCAVYLLLGMAVIAMCFNLMQEQVVQYMRTTKRVFKACCRCNR